MPVTAEFDRDVLVIVAVGVHTVADSRSAILAALDTPGAPRARGLVFDVRKSKSAAGRSKVPIKAAISFLDSIRDRFGSRYSLVVNPTTALQTVRLMVLGLEAIDIDVHLAPTVEEAVAWCRGERLSAPGGHAAAV